MMMTRTNNRNGHGEEPAARERRRTLRELRPSLLGPDQVLMMMTMMILLVPKGGEDLEDLEVLGVWGVLGVLGVSEVLEDETMMRERDTKRDERKSTIYCNSEM
jgi:hypothetical protein